MKAALGFQQVTVSNDGFALAACTIVRIVLAQQKLKKHQWHEPLLAGDLIYTPNEIFSMNTQDTFKFAETHEWADLEDDGLVWVGISNHAQEALGDVMFFQAPKLGQQVKRGEAIAAIESVKAASDIHAPVSGEVVSLNEAVDAAPELVNEKPYGVWLFKIKPNSSSNLVSDLDQLMSHEKYSATAGG